MARIADFCAIFVIIYYSNEWFLRKKHYLWAKKHFVYPDTGLVQKEIDPNGHTVHVEYDDFVMENYRDKDFGFKPLIQYRHGEEQ